MREVGERKKQEKKHGEEEGLERLWLELKRLWDMIALCIDGFYLRQEADFDVVVNIMETCKNNVDEMLKMVCRMTESIEREQKND